LQKIGLFSPFEWYLGGGERYLMKMAEVLAEAGYLVEVIGSQPLAGSQFERLAGLPINVTFRYRPELVTAWRRYIPKRPEYDLFISLSNRLYPPIYPLGRHNWLMLQFPMPSPGIKHWPALVLTHMLTLRYQQIICNSEFTRGWIERRSPVSLRSRILSRIRIISPPALSRYYQPENTLRHHWILGVGRFFRGEHNKKQLEMVQNFRQMVEEGLTGWELHLAGTTRNGLEQQAYVEAIRLEAQGFPVVLHLNCDEAELLGLYRAARIFWHATGLDEQPEIAPEKLEHFGMTTVEAMASGVVPVVIGQGGQSEIVQNEQNGLIFQNLAELKQQTLRLTRDPKLWQELSCAARNTSWQYAESEFAHKILKLAAQS